MLETYYQVEELLGQGGFGTVFSGYRRRDGLKVAIKRILKKKVSSWTTLVSTKVYLSSYIQVFNCCLQLHIHFYKITNLCYVT